MLSERRNAAGYLRMMSEAAPDAKELLASAADLYEQVADLTKQAWPWGHSMGAKVDQALAEADTRREIARHVRTAAAKEAQAIEKLEQALEVLDQQEGNPLSLTP